MIQSIGISLADVHDSFWQLIDRAPFGVIAVDADFRLLRVSDGAKPTFGAIDPLIGRDMGEILSILWPEAFANDLIRIYRETLATGTSYRAPTTVEQRNDRNTIEAYDWGVDRVVLADGRPGLVAYFYDLTSRVQYETELQERQLRLNLAYNAAQMGAWDVNLETGKTVWTPQLYQMFAADPNVDSISDVWNDRVHPDDKEAIKAAYAMAAALNEPLDMDFRIVLPDGEIRHIASKGEVAPGQDGAAARMIGVNFDITTRKKAEIALRDSEQRLRRILDNSIAFAGVLDIDGNLKEANRPALEVAGIAREDVIGKPFWETFWWTHDPAASERLRDAFHTAKRGKTVQYDAVVRAAEGQMITIEFLLAPVYDESGALELIVASAFDISQREEARARVQALMGEINHRTKNILTLVQIIARQTARGGAADFVDRFETRVAALARAQDLLVMDSSDRVDLMALALSQIGHFTDMVGARIHLDGPPVALGPHAAQSIGMALHELATNASKYGALSTDKGHIDVTWRKQGSAFALSWIERDGPTVCEPERRGFGSTVIKQLAAAGVNGEVVLDYPETGVEWRLACPVSGLTMQD